MTEATLVKSKYKAKYILNGLSCSNCAAKIEKAVQELPYVLEAEMNFAVSKILIEGNSDKVENMTKELQELVDQIESGITVEQGSGKIREYSQKYILEGLTCSNCAGKIEKAVNDLPQVEKAELNFATSKISIQGENIDNSSFRGKLQEIADRIEPGLTIREAESKANKENSNDNSHAQDHSHGTEEENSYMKRRFWPGVVLFAIAIILFEIPAISSKVAEMPAFIEWILYGSSYLLIGGPVLMAAYKNIKRGQVFDENFLMGIATIGAFAIQEFPEGVAVMLFYMVGEMFQEKAVDRSRRSIKSLMDIRPDYANLKTDDGTQRVDPESVQIGDVILIKPGEKVPLDGEVLEGSSMLDTSALTGESVPRKVEPGEDVLGGMINKNGLLTVKVNKEYGQSTVAKILDLVENASGKKAPTEQFITKFARYYTPVVVYAALAIAVLPPLFLPGAVFVDWFYRALIFLVISCPCALVVSIPLGFFGGIGRASRQGILVKGGNYLEALNNVTEIVFDKTGTLTKGEFSVSKVESYNGFKKNEILAKAAYAESHSTHPIAKSILEAYEQDIETDKIDDYQEISGHGIRAVIDDQEVLAGNIKLMNKENIDCQEADEDGTIVYLAIDKKYAGYITITDEIKADTAEAIKGLKKLGIRNLTMLTGDRKAVAESVAARLGLDNYYAELLPDQKVEKVEELLTNKDEKDKLIFVGDGINDAPVLARSDIGVAMGGLGSDAAIEAADVVLMTDEPSKLITAIETARKTKRIVWQNIIVSLAVKGFFVVLGALGMATIWEAVFADVGVALLAVLNAMRISRNV
ncbi:Cd2+/Zn2+-exporting ATPase [Halanaerobium congolense]|jgi:Cd2+/Zn2+-exporting ATPase|uniref:Cd2+/Zn2+-exporting ATPase n=2 Tax=Halanaerobium TaxID=2330 RepID=A0A1G7RMN9_9FIRM|nr:MULTISPECIES: heavy metal translocating P-type ATPase [Halanaerobium]KXS48280.1 MAG: Cd2+/Zn2+-exporting ATPase [Halanaerobium sp. T82-1]PTX17706.1 Cd2+/Zn2+-exporting ATPase [Halanaerobium congolense]PXV62261.1 Cd2+/Zn2+-exporting ATPase [Halanaerobium congolense]TDV97100.1 Cd2+/Zn2+-exporting ATPase [Halanaerobium saccharolyticum]TDX48984.1 Cd2+/Zn2+-exporting ATPase [Halanaerobium saccharolyticum]